MSVLYSTYRRVLYSTYRYMTNIHVVICTAVLTIACLAISHRLILLILLDQHHHDHDHFNHPAVKPSRSNEAQRKEAIRKKVQEEEAGTRTAAAAAQSIYAPMRVATTHAQAGAVGRPPPLSSSSSSSNNESHCPRSVESSYRSTDSASVVDDLHWCHGAKNKHRVEIGRSWGSLSKRDKFKWDKLNWCDDDDYDHDNDYV